MGDVETVVLDRKTRPVAARVVVNDDVGLRAHGRVDGTKLHILSVILGGAQLADPLLEQLHLLLVGADDHYRHELACSIDAEV